MKIDAPHHLLPPADAGPGPASVLLVGHSTADVAQLQTWLAGSYRVLLAASVAEAAAHLGPQAPGLILLDARHPGLDGLQACRQLKACGATPPVLLLTPQAQPEDQRRALEAGCADIVAAPIHPKALMARVAAQMQAAAWQARQLDHQAWLQAALAPRLAEVDALRDATLYLMVSFAEFGGDDTGNHVRRTQGYVRTLAHWLQGQGDTRYALSDDEIDQIAKAAPLHDIGNVAIPDGILLKPARLTPEEFSIMKTHALRGWELLAHAAQRLGDTGCGYLQHAKDIARHHHERWDGSGYPDGLAGAAIPLSARLMAVADVYDALISRRPYKGAMDPDEALHVIGNEAGRHFDPTVVMAMQATFGQISEIASSWPD